jgi:RES domain-containing protein
VRRVAAPHPTYRLIPSKFPPINLFETVATAGDLEAVIELAGWTNDRLVAERLARLPQSEWVFGRANASIVMAAFLHAAPGGSRFNGAELGAWYASAELATAAAEVGHHLRREALARAASALRRTFRAYTARLAGSFLDLSEDSDELLAPASYAAGQAFGEAERASGGDGMVYPSVRYRGGTNAVAYRPRKVLDVVQADHFDIAVSTDERRIEVTRLSPK